LPQSLAFTSFQSNINNADLAAVWFGLKDFDKAFYYLDQCSDKRVEPVSYFIEYPEFKGIRNDPRFIQLTERIEFPVD